MKKKTFKKTKAAEQLQQKIEKSQNAALMHLKMRVERLRDSAQNLIDKIERDGIEGYYSQNHDCLRYSKDVWTACSTLGQLKQIKSDLEH
jgi:hypothetical protein